jgi:hypothetical protein
VTLASLRDATKADNKPGMMIAWLKRIGVIPLHVQWKRTNRLPNTNLNPDAIPVRYLAEFAYEWDSWGGGSTPVQFVKALSFEVKGTPEKESTNKVLVSLGTDARSIIA